MFDIGFSELMVISLVALIVIGPERLPKVARTVGHLLGRLQRYVSDVKSDISREMQLEELRKMQQQIEQSARETELTINRELRSAESSLNEAAGAAMGNDQAPTAEETPAQADAASADTAARQASAAQGGDQQLSLNLSPATEPKQSA